MGSFAGDLGSKDYTGKNVKDLTPVEILDKNLDQEQLGKDLFEKYVSGQLKEKKDQLLADIKSGKVDLIPGTDIDNMIMEQLLEAFAKALGI